MFCTRLTVTEWENKIESKRLWSLVSEPDLRKRDEARVGSTGYPQFETPRTWPAVSLTGNFDSRAMASMASRNHPAPDIPKISKNPTSQDYSSCQKIGWFPGSPISSQHLTQPQGPKAPTWWTWWSWSTPQGRRKNCQPPVPNSAATTSGRWHWEWPLRPEPWQYTWLETVRSEKFWWFHVISGKIILLSGERLEQMFGSKYFLLDKQVAVCCLAPNFLVTTDTKLNVERMPGYPKAFWESGLQTMNKCLAMWVTQALPQIEAPGSFSVQNIGKELSNEKMLRFISSVFIMYNSPSVLWFTSKMKCFKNRLGPWPKSNSFSEKVSHHSPPFWMALFSVCFPWRPGARGVGPKKAWGKPISAPGTDRTNSSVLFGPLMVPISWAFPIIGC